MFDFIETHPKVFTGFEIIIEFERNTNENMMYTGGNNAYKKIFEDLSLLLAHIQLKNNARKLQDELYLFNEPIKWNHYEIHRINKIEKDEF